MSDRAEKPVGDVAGSDAMEMVATELLPLVAPIPDIRQNITWVEHCPGAAPKLETFNFVTFRDWTAYGPEWARNAAGMGFAGPRWTPCTKGEMEDLLGAPAAEVAP